MPELAQNCPYTNGELLVMFPGKRLSTLLIATLAATLFLSSLTLQAADKVQGVRRLPPKVYALLTIPDVKNMKERSKKSPMLKLWNDPELAEFKDQIMSEVMNISDKINEHIGIGIKEILKIPQGEISIAFIEDSEGQLAGVSMIDYGDQEDNLFTLLDALKLGMDALNAEQSSNEIEGTEVTDFKIPSKDEEEEESAGKEKHLYYFTKDTFFVISNKESAIKDVLARWDGTHEETFANNENYKYIVQRTAEKDNTPSIVWYMNPINLTQKMIQKYGQGNFQAQMALGFFPSLGLNKLRAVGGSLFESTEDFENISRTVICIDKPVTGFPAIFTCNTSHQAPPKWVPKNVASYNAVNWNVEAAYNSIETMVDSIQGKGFFSLMINKLQNDENGPQIHIKNDIIDQLTGEIQIVSAYDPSVEKEAEAEEPSLNPNMGGKVLFSVGFKDGKAIGDLIKNVIKTKGFPGEVREFQGATLYEMKDETSGISSGFTLHQGQFIFTSHIPMLEDVLRGTNGDNSLVDSEEYKAISAHFPRETSIISYQKQEDQIKMMYTLAKSGVLSQFIPQLDFTSLPDFDLIKKYFSTTGSYAIPDERGALLVSFTPLKK